MLAQKCGGRQARAHIKAYAHAYFQRAHTNTRTHTQLAQRHSSKNEMRLFWGGLRNCCCCCCCERRSNAGGGGGGGGLGCRNVLRGINRRRRRRRGLRIARGENKLAAATHLVVVFFLWAFKNGAQCMALVFWSCLEPCKNVTLFHSRLSAYAHNWHASHHVSFALKK